MKDFSNFISVASLVILFGYMTYNEVSHRMPDDRFSDEGVNESPLEYPGDPAPAISFDLPTEASFAGEPVPLEIPDVLERLDKELQINTYLHSNTIFLMKRANRWFPQMQEIMKKYDIPDDFKYLPLIESNLLNVVSPREAVGYWQILKGSGKEYGLEVTKEVDERYDPLKATEAACKYLKKAHAKFGNWTLAAASYNRGMNGLDRAIENQNVNSYYDLYLNDETSRYVFRLLAIKLIIQDPATYGFHVKQDHLYQSEPLRYIEITQTIDDLIAFSQQQSINYKLLKRHNPWLREDKLTVKKGRSYHIALPSK